MPRHGSWLWTAALLCALGCAGSEEGAAQEQPPASPEQPGKQEPKPQAKDEKDLAQAEEKAEEARRYDLLVSEKGTDKPFRLSEGAMFVPEVSLFGGEGGKTSKLLRLKRGAAELTIPFRRIKRIEVKNEKDDRLEVTVKLVPAEGQEETELQGSVKAGLELRGTYAGTGLQATAKLREVTAVELVPQK